jgi:hypothetical protein
MDCVSGDRLIIHQAASLECCIRVDSELMKGFAEFAIYPQVRRTWG